jgi:hypothetical protein
VLRLGNTLPSCDPWTPLLTAWSAGKKVRRQICHERSYSVSSIFGGLIIMPIDVGIVPGECLLTTDACDKARHLNQGITPVSNLRKMRA